MNNTNINFRNYKILEEIGKGSYGIVYKIKIEDKIYAMKKINLSNLSDDQILNIENEVKILGSLSHENIVKYYSSFIEKDEFNQLNENFNIIMEYCESGDLSQFIISHKLKNIQIDKIIIKNIFIQIVKALTHIHHKKILHRDLKSMNVFLSKNKIVKLGDFGVAKILNKNFANTFIGTPYYLSPELCQEKPYNEKSDIWSLGCILYELLTLSRPFESNSHLGLLNKIVNGKYEKILNKKVDEFFITLIDKLLCKDCNRRPSALEIMKYDYFNEDIIENKIIRIIPHIPNIKKSVTFNQRIMSANITNNRVRINPKLKSGNLIVQIINYLFIF